MAKLISLIAKLGALFFVLALDTKLAIQLQLLGGIWIIQTVPAVILGLYTRWFDPRALLIGLVVGVGTGTWMAWMNGFKNATYKLVLFGLEMPGYAALYTLLLNLAVAGALTLVFRAASKIRHADITIREDYA